MKKVILILICLFFGTKLFAIDPVAIIKKAEDMYKGETSKGIFT
jgi:hypothetical protein